MNSTKFRASLTTVFPELLHLCNDSDLMLTPNLASPTKFRSEAKNILNSTTYVFSVSASLEILGVMNDPLFENLVVIDKCSGSELLSIFNFMKMH